MQLQKRKRTDPVLLSMGSKSKPQNSQNNFDKSSALQLLAQWMVLTTQTPIAQTFNHLKLAVYTIVLFRFVYLFNNFSLLKFLNDERFYFLLHFL